MDDNEYEDMCDYYYNGDDIMDDSWEEQLAEAEYYVEKFERESEYLRRERARQRKAELAMYQACSRMGCEKPAEWTASTTSKRTKKRIGIVCSEEQYKTIKRLALENNTNMSDYIMKRLFG